ncbi:MAG TPA: iron-containing redox enzyme family protein [Actinomycetales bacterium]|nr:iron-containing redox enzyme family protein [Actinomycetales bacterium]
MTTQLADLLVRPAQDCPEDALDRLTRTARAAVASPAHHGLTVLEDDDIQLGLYLLYELHYGGLEGVDDRWEWHPGLLRTRAVLEAAFEDGLRAAFATAGPLPEPHDLPAELFAFTSDTDRPPGGPVANFVAREATSEQVRELMVLRSPYQLKEADPYTFAVPRLSGAPKAALVEIQADEYGGGRQERMHAELFARSMRGLGLDDTPNAYVDHIPALWFAVVNAISLFGLHRRLRGALCGHLAVFEMTSSLPCRRYVIGLQRLGFGEDVTEFFDEHVEADAVHEQVAAHDLVGRLVIAEPELVEDVMFGARVSDGIAALAGERALGAFARSSTALRIPLEDSDSSSDEAPGAAA